MGRKKLAATASLILTAGVLFGLTIGPVVSADGTLTYLRKIQSAFMIIQQHYVEEIDAEDLIGHAMKSMLEGLDPHSVYLTADEMKRVNEDFDASFEGIGIQFEMIQGTEGRDTIAVVSVIPGGPSEEAGLLSGDRIINIAGQNAVGYTTEQVQRGLKGPKGSTVTVGIRRPGTPQTLSFTITRNTVPIVTVDAAYMVDEQTGFIRINRFAKTTYTEFYDALRQLKKEGMRRLILDLRDNAGGYMDKAIQISDEFLSEGQTIVSARSRHPQFSQSYPAQAGGEFEDRPVIVLINGNSASASEIVAGALQDHDRALLVGKRSFGKGLVQRQYPMVDGSAIRLTISRYMTPSGRIIQTPYHIGDREGYYEEKKNQRQSDVGHSVDEMIRNVPDSLKFHTTSGRLVIGGGGILPDVIAENDTASTFMRALWSKNLEATFTRWYMDNHGAEIHLAWDGKRQAYIRSFQVSDALFQSFLKYLEQNGIKQVTAAPEKQPEGGYQFTAAELRKDELVLKTRLKAHIGRRLYDAGIWYPIINSIDQTFQAAMQQWSSAESLAGNYAR